MSSAQNNRLLGLPVMHAVFLAFWALLQPRETWTPLLLWGLWVPVVWFLFSPRILLLVCVGAAPFLGFHAFHQR